MSYINCTHCGSSNKAQDSNCYSCGQGLSAPPPEVPRLTRPNKNEDLAKAAGGVVTARNMDRESTWKDGLRSGLRVGFWFALISTALYLPQCLGAPWYAIHFLSCMAGATVIGLAAGQLGYLCYQYDAVKVGSALGLVYAIKTFNVWGIATGGGLGGFLGAACSFVEKRSRGQHAELW